MDSVRVSNTLIRENYSLVYFTNIFPVSTHLSKPQKHHSFILFYSYSCRGGGADLTKIQPAGIRTKSGGARSIEGGKGPAGSGLSLGVAGVENGGRKDATFLRPPW